MSGLVGGRAGQRQGSELGLGCGGACDVWADPLAGLASGLLLFALPGPPCPVSWDACTAWVVWPGVPGLWVAPSVDGEPDGDGEALGEPLGDCDGLGEALGEPEPELPVGLGLGELDGPVDAEPDGPGVAAQLGEDEPGEPDTWPPGPVLYTVLPPPGPDDEEWPPGPPPEPPPFWPGTFLVRPDGAITDGNAAIAQDAEATTNSPVASAAAGRSQPSRSDRPGSGRNLLATAPAAWRSQCPAGPGRRRSGSR